MRYHLHVLQEVLYLHCYKELLYMYVGIVEEKGIFVFFREKWLPYH